MDLRLPSFTKLLFWILALPLLFAGGQATASHLLGGDLTYVFLDANGPAATPFHYRIQLKAYVDGSTGSNFPGGNLGNNALLGIYNAGTNALVTTLIIPSDSNSGIIAPVPLPIQNGCNFSPSDAQIKYFLTTFTTEVFLPFSLSGYNLIYSSAARSNSIVNIDVERGGNGQASAGTSFTAFIPSSLYRNSSPQFVDPATAFLCLSDTTTLANNATDPDGDRLIYNFVTPYNGDQTPNLPNTYTTPRSLNFNSGYSLSQPFGANGIATIDPATGFTRYHANAQGTYVVAFEIKEYRTLSNGTEILLSTTRREVQLLFRDCLPNVPPAPNNGAPGTTPVVNYTIQEGEAVSFNVGATDSDSITLSATSDIIDGTAGAPSPRATLPTVKGIGAINSTFSWQTACGTRGSFPVNVRVIDKGCPPKTTNAIYTINVTAFTAPRTLVGTDTACGDGIARTYGVSSQAPDAQFVWSASGGTIQGSAIGKTVRVIWSPVNSRGISTAFLRVRQTSTAGCKDSTTFPIRVFGINPLVIAPNGASLNLCQGDTLRLAATGGHSNFRWSRIDSTTLPTYLSSLTDSIVRATPPNSVRYAVASFNAVGCPARDTVAVRFVPDVAKAGADSAFCSGLQTTLGSDSVRGYNYLWTPAQGIATPRLSRTKVSLANGSQVDQTQLFIQTATERASGCVSTDTVRVTVRPLPIANAGPDTATFCSLASTRLVASSSFPSAYKWSFSAPVSLSSTTDSITTATGRTAGNFDVVRSLVRLTVTDRRFGCIGKDSITLRINPLPRVLVGRLDSVCAGRQIILGDTVFSGYSYVWQGPNLANTTSATPTFTAPIALGDTATPFLYRITVTNQYTCVDSGRLTIRRNNLPRANAGPDKQICSGDSTQIGTPANPLYSYQWAANPGLSNTGIAQPRYRGSNGTAGGPDQFTLIQITATNRRSTCTNFDFTQVTIHSRPVVDAAGSDTLAFCANATASLGLSGASGVSYAWTASASGDTLFTANAAATQIRFGNNFNNGGQSIIRTIRLRAVTDSTGCDARDSVVLNILPRPSLPLGGGVDADLIGTACPLQPITVAPLSFNPDSLRNRLEYTWLNSQYLNLPLTRRPTFTYTQYLPGDTVRNFRYPVTVRYTETDCENTQTYRVRVNPTPIARAGRDTAVCSGESFRVGEAPEAGRSYQWLTTTGLASTTVAATSGVRINPTQQDSVLNYVLGVIDTRFRPLTACGNLDTVAITIRPLPLAEAGSDSAAVCSQGSVVLGGPNVPLYRYLWTPATGLSSDTAAQPSLVLSSLNTVFPRYRVLVTNRITGCRKADSITVRVNPLPLVITGTGRTACAGQPLALGAFAADSAQYTYAYTASAPGLGADTARSRATFLTEAPGSYQVSLLVRNNATGCQDQDTVALLINPLPFKGALGIDTVGTCADNPITFGPLNAGDTTYSYTYLTSGTATLTPLPSGQLQLSRDNQGQTILRDTLVRQNRITATGCVAFDTVAVSTFPRALDAVFNPSPLAVCPGTVGEPYSVVSNPGYVYTWGVLMPAVLRTGQGTDSVTVDYANQAGQITLTVDATNAFGCGSRQRTPRQITVNQRLQPATPASVAGNTRLCVNQGTDSYFTVTSPNSRYTFRYLLEGGLPSDTGRVVTGSNQVAINWPRQGLARVWVEELASPPPPAGECFGRSDTLSVRVYRSPDTTLAVQGPAQLCQFTGGNFSLAGLDSSGYRWSILSTGSDTVAFTGQGDSLITATPQVAGSYLVSAFETTVNNCPGKLLSLPLTVNPKPTPAIEQESLAICPGALSRTFGVTGSQPSSTFSWLPTGGRLVDPSNTNSALVIFDSLATKGLRVVETSPAGCVSDTLSYNIFEDRTRLQILSVSTLEEDDTKVRVRFRLAGNDSAAQNLAIQRIEGSLIQVGSGNARSAEIQEVIDNAPASTATTVNRYQVQNLNRCGSVLNAAPHSTMLLTGIGNNATSEVSLNWTPYTGFSDLRQYQILREVDGEQAFSPYAPLPTVAASVTNLVEKAGQDGFTQGWRILAIDETNQEKSYSNILRLTFENVLEYSNIVTANGDGIQDTFEPKNLKLYPANSLRVYNRWGREIYSTDNYTGGYVPEMTGTYYYDFTPANAPTKRGWFEVVK